MEDHLDQVDMCVCVVCVCACAHVYVCMSGGVILMALSYIRRPSLKAGCCTPWFRSPELYEKRKS